MSSHFPTFPLSTHIPFLSSSVFWAAPNISLFHPLHVLIETFFLCLAQVDLILLHTHKDTHTCTHLQFQTNPTPVSSPEAPPHALPSYLHASPHRPAAGRHTLNHFPPMPAPRHARSPGRPAQGFCSEARRAQLPPQQPWVPATLAGCGRRQAVLLPCTNLQRRARSTICSGNNSNV